MAERSREGTIIKRRLRVLCEGFPKVREAIEQATEQIQAPGDEHAYDEFDQLLNAQNYRLSFWRVAGEEINYRRFFDINALAAIRMERGDVFEAAHQLIFELIKNNEVHGLRIDHVDGLYHPRRYFAAAAVALRGDAGADRREQGALFAGRENPRQRRAPARRLAGAWDDRLRVREPGARGAGRPRRAAAADGDLPRLCRQPAAVSRARLSVEARRHADGDGERGERRSATC